MICPYCNKILNKEHQIIHFKGNILIGCPQFELDKDKILVYKDKTE